MNGCWLCLCAGVLLGASACHRQAGAPDPLAELEKVFPAGDPNAYLQLARSAVQSNDCVASVMALQTIQRTPGATAAQLRAVQRAMQAITADLVTRAAKGDPQAKADLAAIEKTRSQ